MKTDQTGRVYSDVCASLSADEDGLLDCAGDDTWTSVALDDETRFVDVEIITNNVCLLLSQLAADVEDTTPTPRGAGYQAGTTVRIETIGFNFLHYKNAVDEADGFIRVSDFH